MQADDGDPGHLRFQPGCQLHEPRQRYMQTFDKTQRTMDWDLDEDHSDDAEMYHFENPAAAQMARIEADPAMLSRFARRKTFEHAKQSRGTPIRP